MGEVGLGGSNIISAKIKQKNIYFKKMIGILSYRVRSLRELLQNVLQKKPFMSNGKRFAMKTKSLYWTNSVRSLLVPLNLLPFGS